MPFQSKSQMRACFAKQKAGTAGSWNCKEWASHTKSPKGLPEHSKKASDIFLESYFTKLAKKSFDEKSSPVISTAKMQQMQTAPAVQDAIVRRIGNVVKSNKASKSQSAKATVKTASIGWNMSKTDSMWGQ